MNRSGPPLELTDCPQCSVPAEITERFTLVSTHGAVEHLTVLCAARHHLTVLVERMPVARRSTSPPG